MMFFLAGIPIVDLDGTLRSFFYNIDIALYSFIEDVYDFIIELGSFNLFDFNSDIYPIARRLYVFLGIIMLFRVALTLVSMVTAPDSPTLTDKKDKHFQGRLVTNIITTLSLILVLPVIFGFTIRLQDAVIGVERNEDGSLVRDKTTGRIRIGNNNLLYNLIMGNKEQEVPEGRITAPSGFTCSYMLRVVVPDDDVIDNYNPDPLQDIKKISGDVYKDSINLRDLNDSSVYTNEGSFIVDTGVIEDYEDEPAGETYNDWIVYPQSQYQTYEASNQFRDSRKIWDSAKGYSAPGEIIYDAETTEKKWWTYLNMLTIFSSDKQAEGATSDGTATLAFNGGDTAVKNDCYTYLSYYKPDFLLALLSLYGLAVASGDAANSLGADVVLTGYYSYDRLESDYFIPTQDTINDINTDEDEEMEDYQGLPYWALVRVDANVDVFRYEGARVLISYIMRTFMKGNFDYINDYIDIGDYLSIKNDKEGEIIQDAANMSYLYGISTLVILAILMILILLTFDLALRIIKIGFLQLISPIPVITYISSNKEKEPMLHKWLKQYAITYVDVFIRLSLIFFVMFILNKLTTLGGGLTINMVNIFILVGALMFAKEAPKLIGNIFDIEGMKQGTFSLNPMKKLRDVPIVGKATAAGLGILGGAFQGRKYGLGGLFKGAIRGGMAGGKSVPFMGSNADVKRSAFNTGRDSVWTAAGNAGTPGIANALDRSIKRTRTNSDNRRVASVSTRSAAGVAAANATITRNRAQSAQAQARSNTTAAVAARTTAQTNMAGAASARATAQSNYTGASGRTTAAQNTFAGAAGAVNSAQSNLAGAAGARTSAQGNLAGVSAAKGQARQNLANAGQAVRDAQEVRDNRQMELNNIQTQRTEAESHFNEKQRDLNQAHSQTEEARRAYDSIKNDANVEEYKKQEAEARFNDRKQAEEQANTTFEQARTNFENLSNREQTVRDEFIRADNNVTAAEISEEQAAQNLRQHHQAEESAAADLRAATQVEDVTAADLRANYQAQEQAAADLRANYQAEQQAQADLQASQQAEAQAAADLRARTGEEAQAQQAESYYNDVANYNEQVYNDAQERLKKRLDRVKRNRDMKE